jgi:hypothetical protein
MKGTQFSFNAGELSPEIEGRVDLAKYGSSCRTMRNFIPRTTGAARKRPGLRFIKEVKDSADETFVIPFEFSDTQAYILEFGDFYFRVYKDGGVVLETAKTITGITNANPGEVTCTAHGYSNGDQVFISGVGGMTQVNGLYFTVTSTGANTFTIGVNTTSYGTYTTGGTSARVYTVVTPYAFGDVALLSIVQSADTMYVAHRDYMPRKITRTGHAAWTIAEIAFDWPAFRTENTTNITLYASASTGAGITVTASAALFSASDVGRRIKFRELVASKHPVWIANTLMRWNGSSISVGDTGQYNGNVYELQDKHGASNPGYTPPIHTEPGEENSDGDFDWIYRHSGEGYVLITAFSTSTSVTATVVQRLPESVVGAGDATKTWSFDAWSEVTGYPRAVTFYEDRLWFAGTASDPQTLWASALGDYENHRVYPTDTSSLIFTISDDEVNVVEWLKGGRQMVIGTAGGIFPSAGADPDKPVSPSNTLQAPKHSDEPAQTGVRPVVVGASLLFAARTGRGLIDTAYDFGSDSYATQDLSILADHLIAAGGISHIAWQRRPDRVLWCVTGDGKLLGMSFEKSQDVIGWHAHPVGGAFSGGDAVVESIAVISHPDGDQDQVWLVVKRTINAGTKRYIEVLEKPFSATAATEDAFYVDSGLTYDGAPTTAITGLAHLEGQSVTVWADGAQQGPFTVSAGAITLSVAASVVQAGLGYNADLAPQAPETALQDGSIQGRKKQQTGLVFRLYRTSRGLTFGPDISTLYAIPWTNFQNPSGTALALFSGDTQEIPFHGPIESRGTIYLRHAAPGPCNVLAVMPRFTVEE